MPIADRSVKTVITSIPYYRMRAYEIPPVLWGGDHACRHEFTYYTRKGRSGGKNSTKLQVKGSQNFQIIPDQKQAWCELCDGWLGQYGNEPTLAHYINNTRLWVGEAKRVLADDGTMWINITDTYAREDDWPHKPKDLMLVPFEIATILRQTGWYLRAMLPWFKRNAFSSHAPDRPVISHEYVILVSKSKDYFYNQELVDGKTAPRLRRSMDWFEDGLRAILNGENIFLHYEDDPLALIYSNQGYKGNHFAPFSTRFVEAMIAASTAPGDLVLDPFMGSGSTAVAAQRLKRRWVGLELGWGYIQQARKRILDWEVLGDSNRGSAQLHLPYGKET